MIAGHREQLLVGGRWVEAESGDRFEVTDPATGDPVGSVPDAGRADVEAAIDAAAAALEGWRSLAAIERARILRRSAELIRERKDEIGAVMTAEQGKPLAEAVGEVDYAAGFLEWFSGEAERVYGQVVPAANAANRVLVLRQPVGVTAAITPWNFPAAMMTRKLGPAMAAGCTSVVKPASATPLTAALVLRAIEDAGAPPGVVNLVTSRSAAMVAETLFGDRARAQGLVHGLDRDRQGADPHVGRAGEAAVARARRPRAVPHLRRRPARGGRLRPRRVEVPERRPDLCLRQPGVRPARRLRPGRRAADREDEGARPSGPATEAGVAIGPLIDSRAVEKVEEHVGDAVGRGARLTTGGARLAGNGFDGGSFYEPTVLADVTREMLISHEETFGPVAAVAPFDTEEDAIRLANDTEFGLAAYFHTRDYARLFRVAERLEYGIVGANSGAISSPNVPFGGVKESGYGREGGDFGIDEYLDVKYVLVAGVD